MTTERIIGSKTQPEIANAFFVTDEPEGLGRATFEFGLSKGFCCIYDRTLEDVEP